ncbi:MAG: arginine--tRNA ligase [Nanoarchaeota archaeon]|nr:arginine--tRNA ligase [Nanoarchaeota archaeon]
MDFKDKIAIAISKKLRVGKKEIFDVIEVPPDDKLGDFSFPCFKFAGKNKPAEIANDLSKKIKISFIDKIEVKGPYLNFFVNKKNLAESVLSSVFKEKENYGRLKLSNKKVMVEFSQANTHKAFHVGHIRGTSLGESISRILDFCGNEVVRANYQGDTGMHVAKWIWCYQKYHSKDKLVEDEAWIAHIYVDAVKRLSENPEFQKEVDDINRKLESKEDLKLNALWNKTRLLSLGALSKIYKDLDTKFDEYFFESHVEKKGKEISKKLVKKKIAEISDEATIMRLEDYNLGVWVLLRSDGTVLYSAKDLALAEEKFMKHKIQKAVYVVGKEQEMHFHQLFKTLEIMEFKQAKNCQYVPVSEVRLPHGKMSSRTGDNVLYSDFKNELIKAAKKEILKREKLNDSDLEKRALAIAVASMKYSMLNQGNNKTIVFDKDNAMKFEGDTGPYLQYTYARACSILRKSKKKKSLYAHSISDKETSLLKKIYDFPMVVKKSFTELDPSPIANYSHGLAKSFNEFYNSCKVIGDKEEVFRLSLVEAFKITLGNALYLLGIKALNKM